MHTCPTVYLYAWMFILISGATYVPHISVLTVCVLLHPHFFFIYKCRSRFHVHVNLSHAMSKISCSEASVTSVLNMFRV